MNAFPRPPKIIVFTGPALSRESGFAPFDPATMPLGVGLEDVVTREGFTRNPALVQDFYNGRRREMLAGSPSPAHEALAALDLTRPGELLIVTRNVADFHERAGSRAAIHTQGELLKARCLICTKISDWFDDLSDADRGPICGNTGHLRPHIVWVGEEPLGVDKAYIALATCESFITVGNAGGEPGRSFLAEAKRVGAQALEFTREPTPLSADFDDCILGPLSETVTSWVKRTIAG